MSRLAALGAMLALAGCVTAGAEPPDVGNYKGQPSAPILAKLGPPQSQEATATEAIYRWRSSIVQESAPVTQTVVSYATLNPSTSTVTTFEPQRQYCSLTMTVDAAGRVIDFVRDGSRQACAPLTNRLTSP